MKVRLGYVSLSMALDTVTSSRTITYTNYEKDGFPVEKLNEIINQNLNALYKILTYNVKNNIHFYRLTSKLIPLATHNKVNFDYINPFKDKYKTLKELINKYGLRVDTHPDQYAVLNSMSKKIVDNTVEILEYHYKIQRELGIKKPIIILHVGSSAGGKKAAITRFINNFNKLPDYLKKSIAVENDDKIFNVIDVLSLCKKINVPMVLDYHHYVCNNEGENLCCYIKDIIATWKDKTPKYHFSSPKSKLKKEYRSHSEFVNSDDFIVFLNILKTQNNDADIMLEAKAKDDALSRLVRELKYKTNYNFIDESTFII